MVSISCGGGGYGSPLERDPALVLDDVREGWITRTRAGSVYGVILTDEGALAEAETAALRAERRIQAG
jgi:N-methylhydantoinase B